ncbi:Kinesin-like protein KIN-4A [Lathyrus oleraceus]|uniref:Kinesin-like protein KIN-4A n=1 Tax=Pisum sativum TaxID=3888 RepID=A0A9D4XW94_PEA|nr:Kinesin-like protein KIN-4A [Pisum sativum]
MYEEQKELVKLVDAKLGQEYELIVTTYAELYRYRIGDVLKNFVPVLVALPRRFRSLKKEFLGLKQLMKIFAVNFMNIVADALLWHSEKDAYDGSMCNVKTDGLKRGLPITNPDYPVSETTGASREIEEVAKEWEHTLLQNIMDRELHELNKCLEQKESDMKLFGSSDAETLKQHFGRKIVELEDGKRTVQQDRDRLLAEVENLVAGSNGKTHKSDDIHAQKLKALEAQILDLEKKQEDLREILLNH